LTYYFLSANMLHSFNYVSCIRTKWDINERLCSIMFVLFTGVRAFTPLFIHKREKD
jgi:hypothetical protein